MFVGRKHNDNNKNGLHLGRKHHNRNMLQIGRKGMSNIESNGIISPHGDINVYDHQSNSNLITHLPMGLKNKNDYHKKYENKPRVNTLERKK